MSQNQRSEVGLRRSTRKRMVRPLTQEDLDFLNAPDSEDEKDPDYQDSGDASEEEETGEGDEEEEDQDDADAQHPVDEKKKPASAPADSVKKDKSVSSATNAMSKLKLDSATSLGRGGTGVSQSARKAPAAKPQSKTQTSRPARPLTPDASDKRWHVWWKMKSFETAVSMHVNIEKKGFIFKLKSNQIKHQM